MSNLEKALAKYDENKETFDGLGKTIEVLLRQLLRDAGIKIHNIEVRTKGRKETEEKFQRPDKNYQTLDNITDLVGIRVITYFEDTLEAVDKIIRDEFFVIPEHSYDRRKLIESDRFGYLSVHYVCKLSNDRLRLTENKKFKDCVFEIQSRSILQHAWAEIEHAHYKTHKSKPPQIERRNSRLAGLLELADAEFVGIRKDMENYHKLVNLRLEAFDENLSDLNLNATSLKSFIEQDHLVQKLDIQISELFERPLREETNEKTLPVCLIILERVGIITLQQLRDEMIKHEESLIRYIELCIPNWRKLTTQQTGPLSPGLSIFQLGIMLVSASGKVLQLFEEIGIKQRTPHYKEIAKMQEETARQVLGMP